VHRVCLQRENRAGKESDARQDFHDVLLC